MAESARLLGVESLNANTQRITLHSESFTFAAGQYLQVHAGPHRLPLSIASAPSRLPEIELHYRSTSDDPSAQALDSLLLHAAELGIDGPHGNIRYTGPTDGSLTLITGGTGITQAVAILEALSGWPQTNSVAMYWSLAGPDSEYPLPVLELARQQPWLSVHKAFDEAPRRENAAVTLIRAGLPATDDYLLCGPPGFVYACAEALLERGAPRSQLHSDVFDYAPREGW